VQFYIHRYIRETNKQILGFIIDMDHLSAPPQFLEGPRMIPYLSHMPDLPSLKHHHIDIIRSSAFTSRLQSSWILTSSMSPLKNSTSTHRISLLVLSEAQKLVTCIRHHLVYGDHELRIVPESSHPLQGLVLT